MAKCTDALKNTYALGIAIAMIAGYGLLRSANSGIYLSRFSLVDSSFIFMTDLAFNVTSASVTVLCAATIAVLSARGHLPSFSIPIWPPALLLVLCGLAASTGAFDMLPPVEGHIASAAIFAVGSTLLSLAWIELFALERPIDAVVHIACGTLVGVVARYAFSNMPAPFGTIGTLFAVLAGAALLAYARKALPPTLGDEAVTPEIPASRTSRFRAFDEISDTLIAFCVLEAVIGLVNSFMLAAGMHFEGSGGVPHVAMTVAAIIFGVFAFVTHRAPKASTAFRIAFPIIAAMVVFVPFMSEGYSRVFSTLLLLSYDFMAILITYQVARAANKHRVSSYELLGISSTAASACLLGALLLGYTFGQGDAQGVSASMRFLVLGCAVIYLLAMALVFFSRDRRRKHGALRKVGASELASNASEEVKTKARSTKEVDDALETQTPNEDAHPSVERICGMLAAEHKLTERETEVLAYLARGRSNTYIAEELCLSPTTVRGHIRNIYTKLDVHKRQELIDLFE